MNVTFDFDSAEVYTSFVYEVADPLQKMLTNLTDERKKEILNSVTAAAKKYADKNTGIVSFVNEVTLIDGRK